MQILRRRVVWMIREYINHIPAEIKYGVCTRCIKTFCTTERIFMLTSLLYWLTLTLFYDWCVCVSVVV